ncbi:MAG: hypothetical protein NTW07_13245 [candidate division Zixibacteria bacterium]|nr:hypothetical protein [candidate division Zixibacteria bacterium]
MLKEHCFRLITIVVAVVAVVSCAPPPEYVNAEADFGFYQRVGVIPFASLTGDRAASDKVTASFITELLMKNSVEIVPAGDFYKAVRETVKGEKVNLPEEITAAELTALGQATGAQGVFVGAVRDYGMVRVGSDEFPLVGLIVRFLDCSSGKVVWSYETTRRGGPKFPIVSIGETHTLGELTTKVCRDVAARFALMLK